MKKFVRWLLKNKWIFAVVLGILIYTTVRSFLRERGGAMLSGKKRLTALKKIAGQVTKNPWIKEQYKEELKKKKGRKRELENRIDSLLDSMLDKYSDSE
jgi:hypothetical protein